MILGNRCYATIFVHMYNQATLIYFVYKKFYYTLSIDIKFWFFVIKMPKLWHFKYLLSFQAKIVFLSFRIIDHVTDDFHPYIWKMFMTSWIVLLMSHFYPQTPVRTWWWWARWRWRRLQLGSKLERWLCWSGNKVQQILCVIYLHGISSRLRKFGQPRTSFCYFQSYDQFNYSRTISKDKY